MLIIARVGTAGGAAGAREARADRNTNRANVVGHIARPGFSWSLIEAERLPPARISRSAARVACEDARSMTWASPRSTRAFLCRDGVHATDRPLSASSSSRRARRELELRSLFRNVVEAFLLALVSSNDNSNLVVSMAGSQLGASATAPSPREPTCGRRCGRLGCRQAGCWQVPGCSSSGSTACHHHRFQAPEECPVRRSAD